MKTIAQLIYQYFPKLSYMIYCIEEDAYIRHLDTQHEDNYVPNDEYEELPY